MLLLNHLAAGGMCPQHFLLLFLQIQKLFDGNTVHGGEYCHHPQNESRICLFNVIVLKLNVCFL